MCAPLSRATHCVLECLRNGEEGRGTREMRMSASWDLTGNLYAAMFIIQPLSRRQMEGQ